MRACVSNERQGQRNSVAEREMGDVTFCPIIACVS